MFVFVQGKVDPVSASHVVMCATINCIGIPSGSFYAGRLFTGPRHSYGISKLLIDMLAQERNYWRCSEQLRGLVDGTDGRVLGIRPGRAHTNRGC